MGEHRRSHNLIHHQIHLSISLVAIGSATRASTRLVINAGRFNLQTTLPSISRAIIGSANSGYYRFANTCQPVRLPENASLDFTGHNWVCDSGYYRFGNTCQPVRLPENASFDFTGHNWVCNKGYYQVGKMCQRTAIPENASTDF